MKRFGMTKLRALGMTAVTALIVVAANTGLTETRRDNDRQSVNQMPDAPSDAGSSSSRLPSTSDAARDVPGDSGAAARNPGEPGPAVGSSGDPGSAARSSGDSGPAARSPGDRSRAAGSPGDPDTAVRSDSPDGAPRPASTGSPPTSEKVGTRADGAGTTTTSTRAAKQWVQVVNMNGQADRRTAPFRLRGGEVRLRYDYGGDGLFLVSVGEPKPAGEEDEEIYYADRHCSAPCRGVQPLDKQAGEYYVEVRSTRGSWSVVLEEYR